MANKTNKTIIQTAPPKPSKRIIGGSSQRSPLRDQLQGSEGWKFNHAPVGLSQKENYLWWQQRANFTASPLSSSANVSNLITNQAIRGQVRRTLDQRRLSAFNADFDTVIGGGSNQPLNKKQIISGVSFGSFEPELDISNEIFPGTKKRLSFQGTMGGETYNGLQLTPFSAFSSSIVSGYRHSLRNSGLAINNAHDDTVSFYNNDVPMQGPFTERWVGGRQGRHNAVNSSPSFRKEVYTSTYNDSAFSSTSIQVLPGEDESSAHGHGLTLTIGGVAYSASCNNGTATSTATVIGVDGATDDSDIADAIRASLDAAIVANSLPITASAGLAGVVIVSAITLGPAENGTTFGGSYLSTGADAPAFSGGTFVNGSIVRPVVGTPQGQYLRNAGSKSPVNISNIKSSLTNAPGAGVRVLGNYTRNYEVFQTNNRAATNMDFAYNTSNYNYSAPSAFVTPPARRALGLSGSADYPAPRQRTDTRTNDTIFVNRFASPGGKLTSKQQFRDVTSDQFSSNSALPWRNYLVRGPYNKQLGVHVAFGGLVPGSQTQASPYKVNRNETQRIEITGILPNTHVTGNFFDTYYFNRPVPAGDSTQWFFSLSGSDTNTYSEYVQSGSRYPDSITLPTMVFDASMVNVIGRATYLATNGSYQFLWSRSPGVVPWSQLQTGYRPLARFLRNNNLYELLPQETPGFDSIDFEKGTKIRTYKDQAQVANTITNYYSRQYREPLITSRYRPLIHQIQTNIGNSSETSKDNIVLNLAYSYGNSLMGFANRELNTALKGDIKFNHNKVKRPYEVMRQQVNGSSSPRLNGLDIIKMFAYPETVFPKEVNTYLSGSRVRLSFTNSYWRNDAVLDPVTAWYPNYDTLFYSPSILKSDNPQYPRLKAPFTNSQGHVLLRADQLPYNPGNPAYPVGTGPGTGSIWPLDSYLWSGQMEKYASATFNTGSFNSSVILADQTVTSCGELLATSFGTMVDGATDSNHLKATGSFVMPMPATSSVSAQYLYCRSFVTGNAFTGVYGTNVLFPGGPAFSRPPWTAGKERRFVDGKLKSSLNVRSYPFYNSYEDWAEGVRLTGKANSIIPEYRISEHVEEFRSNRSLFTAISSSLEITGANPNIYNGTNTNFYNRFATTDNMEFLSDFMSYDKGDVDYIFNKYPRHLELSSDGIIKLLPYEGFYPVNRTLQLSTLYSQSYGPNSQYTGSTAAIPARWRTLLRPFYAPGIMYNSIKSGLAVDYPIRRVGRNKPNSQAYEDSAGNTYTPPLMDQGLPGYKIGHPLFGCLPGGKSTLWALSGNIPGSRRRDRELMNWSDLNVNYLFWADKLPFESILAPEKYLTAEVTTETGSLATISSDIQATTKFNITGSFTEGQISADNLYKKAVSNFIANVPQFFLTTKANKYGHPGKMSKFVSQFGNPPRGSQETAAAARTVSVDSSTAYMMEIGLLKTEQFNLYSNPAAFGQSTNVSSYEKPWHIVQASGSWVPSGSSWPKHRGEYAPFAPPYYYGPSVARITFMPTGDKTEYTLEEILNNDRGEVFVDFINESGSYYDATSGSFVDSFGNTITTNATPDYAWNRAWLNRMDIDASLSISNEFPLGGGSTYKSPDPNKWTIMPKWETPVLDFPNVTAEAAASFASSTITALTHTGVASGMTMIITTNTTAVTFEVDSSTSSAAKATATNYVIGTNGISSATDLAQRIAAAIELARTNSDIDVSAFAGGIYVSVASTVAGSAMNFKEITGTLVSNSKISPTLFDGGADASTLGTNYNFSSSVNTGEFTQQTQGMWHQYGTMPDTGQGVYMYIKDIPTGDDEEYDLVATLTAKAGSPSGSYHQVRKIPKFIIDSNREVLSLADLCGFDPDEVIRRGFDPTKAKRIGELAMDEENSISEAILALPFYMDESGDAKLITLQASPSELGPKIKEFRKKFTKYSLPPVLAKNLLGMVPRGYPFISDTINPFGGDDYDEILNGEDITQTPVVYLMEHQANLTRQDLADIWQGIMPDLSHRMDFSFSALDHYMPGDNVEEELTQFPEVLKEQIALNAKIRDGHPRYDLLDIAEKACKQGFFPEIKWLVFKVKQRGFSSYGEMIREEVDGPNALGYDNAREFLSLQGLPEDQVDRILGDREEYAKSVYISKHSLDKPTYNWPYDYCSLIESAKIDVKVGFRPDLKKEYGDT